MLNVAVESHAKESRVINGLHKELAADLQASQTELQDKVADDFSDQFTPM